MTRDYTSKYDMLAPTCHSGLCVCPPLFDDVKLSPSISPLKKEVLVPAFKCDKRELQVIGLVHPSSSVYKGSDVTMYCCINMDPNGFVDASGVFFIQNTTLMREATNHPFREDYEMVEGKPACWEMEIKNAQPSDTGSYMCVVTANAPHMQVNYTIEFDVKAPRMIQGLKVESTEKSATVTWESEEGSLIPIDLRLLRRTDNRGQEVFRKENATSPVIVEGLRAATPYTLFVSGKDGAIPFEFTEHFTTKQKRPYSPKEEDVRMLNSGSSLYCEVEWKSPAETNGRITKYFVSVRGSLRLSNSNGELVTDHFPQASDTDKRCANWDGTDSSLNEASINPIDFSTEFYSCKFGPLKPNRNYSVMVWAENNAGRSQPSVFKRQCVTNFAQPDVVSEPQSAISSNFSTFKLTFNQPPDETNGPISCFYIAVVPLHTNVSLSSLPSPSDIVMDSFSKAFANNLHNSAAEKKRYFAYIAESYGQYPLETIIGDASAMQDLKLCNVQYLSRYSAEDLALRTGLKYTGFLIVRVDKQEDTKWASSFTKTGKLGNPNFRKQRQLHLNGPAYGYSDYFKPVILEAETEYSAAFTFLTVLVPILLFLCLVSSVVAVLLYRRNEFLLSWCPLTGTGPKQAPERTLLKQSYGSVAVDDLPSEYIMRHRDSDFLFVQEFEALPHFSFESLASTRKENIAKNRYNDIRAFDETRVKLKTHSNDDHSDYINANFVESWNGQKTFIAAQAPLESTIGDFWRMIWEQQSYLVVMVANLTEKNRPQCAKYWPEDAPIRYGEIIVKPVDQTYYCDYAVRSFDVTNINESDAGLEEEPTIEYANLPVIRNSRTDSAFGNCRRILQYHFINWNDFKAPECSVGLLRFIHILRGIPQFNESPVTIHCSAGVGRTGTFVAIDSMLDQCEAEGKVNVFDFVSKLRKQRNLMVQSSEQYVFIYKALAEWHMYGCTDIEADNFHRQFHAMTDTGMRDRTVSFNGFTSVVSKPGKQNLTALEEEFHKLDTTLDQPLTKTFATSTENIMKNRINSAVPYDKNRVILSPQIGHADTTYYNASHVKGYFYPYIVAQDPISEATVIDFWRMVLDHSVQTIVMLSNEEDWSPSEKYWPEDSNSCEFKQGKLLVDVKLVEEDITPFFIKRKMRYSIKGNGGDSQTIDEVVQYAFTEWPADQLTPTSSEGLVALIGQILERQSKLMDNGPILVHCKDGSSETGIFCCISLLLLRLRAENRVDIFQTVKGLQSQRANMFTEFDQYSFCYRAVSDYITRPS